MPWNPSKSTKHHQSHQGPKTGNSTSSIMADCLITRKKRPISVEDLAASTLMLKTSYWRTLTACFFSACQLGGKRIHGENPQRHVGLIKPDPTIQDCVRQLCYYWPTMHQDVIAYAKSCQKNAKFITTSSTDHQSCYTRWSHHGCLRHEAWGTYITRPISSSLTGDTGSSSQLTDFTKWAETVPLEVKSSNMVNFFKQKKKGNCAYHTK